MDKNQLRDSILKQIERPRIPQSEISVLTFGAVPDAQEIQTAVLQKAIDTVSAQGGGRLVIPAGVYRTGALRLQSLVDLHLDKGAVLQFVSEEPEKHYPLVFVHWEATPCYNFSPLIYACDAHDIALTGEGTLEGGADQDHWWNWHHQVENAWSENKPDLQQPDRKLLRKMNMDGVPVKDRVFGPGHFLRPDFVQPIRCERVLISGVTLKHSPFWQLNPVLCKSLTVENVTLSSHGSNNDGCDPESCNGVLIRGCRFDTGDDCISLKSGRDRDGREANIPCENVVIEENEFADGHGGVALGSEMSGGIRRVVAVNNHFSSPNLTYALRLKTNARRGGYVEDVVLADSVMDHVHGAAVHGTMLYEDGRNGDSLPHFRNITVENIRAHGGDYGIFLEAFDEVPITGLVLRNIEIDGVDRTVRCMNWENPVLENIVINGSAFPRPVNVRILGIPYPGAEVEAEARGLGEKTGYFYTWFATADCETWNEIGTGSVCRVPEDVAEIRVKALDSAGNEECSAPYQVLASNENGEERSRLICRGMLDPNDSTPDHVQITRGQLAKMLLPLAALEKHDSSNTGEDCTEALRIAVGNGFLVKDSQKRFAAGGTVTRQEMGTVAMQACGVNYRNASSTMPVCKDVDHVSNNYGTNAARALYFGFMELDADGCFAPQRNVTMKEAVRTLNRVADFAGI